MTTTTTLDAYHHRNHHHTTTASMPTLPLLTRFAFERSVVCKVPESIHAVPLGAAAKGRDGGLLLQAEALLKEGQHIKRVS